MVYFDQALAFFQRLFRESAADTGQARQGELLVAAPGLGQYVRERLLPPPPEAVQDPKIRAGAWQPQV